MMIWPKSALGFWLSAYPKGCSTEIPDSRDKLGEDAKAANPFFCGNENQLCAGLLEHIEHISLFFS
jgi:hypothetical protein